jgi:prepilin-type N-terminal cleavage/methylation domain-containing protein
LNEKGLTLIEVLASIVILSIIVISMLTMFVQSSRTTNVSKNIMEATYLAENEMEEMYNLISSTTPTPTTTTFDSIKANMESKNYSILNTCTDGDVCYEKNDNGYNVFVQLKEAEESPVLVNVNIKVYNGSTNNQEAQMEMLVSWNQ